MVPSRWLLIEVFGPDGHQPTVIAKGAEVLKMRPLSSVMKSSRYQSEALGVVSRAAATGAEVDVVSGDRQRRLVGVPLADFSGHVNAVYFWAGVAGEQPPPRNLAGAWYFNLTTGFIGGSQELLELYGQAPEERRVQRRTAEAFERLQPNADEGATLAMLVRGEPGYEHQGTWTVRRDDGEMRAVNLAVRSVEVHQDDGSVQVLARGVTQDIGSADSIPFVPRHTVERAIILAEQKQQGGSSRVIIDPGTLMPVKWIDPPPDGVAWTSNERYAPRIHPRDVAEARRMAGAVIAGATASGTLRVRATGGGWMKVGVTASEMLLDPGSDTKAALVTVTPLSSGAAPV